ncbi:MAG: hypothetical protein ABL927_08770, partial [Bdellovibrionales bacterium]
LVPLLQIPKAWIFFSSDPLFPDGIKIAAKKIKKELDGDFTPDSNIVSDLISSFQFAGMSEERAYEIFWQFMGAISTQGPSIRMKYVYNGPTGKFVDFIVNAMLVLDYKKSQHGFSLYSYPTQTITGCDNAKPYHFWEIAYFSREFVNTLHIPPNVAAKLAFLLEKIYQIRRDVYTTDLDRISGILTRQPYDPAHQVVRTDIAYAAAGAVFGANNLKAFNSKSIDVNALIVALLQESTPVSPIDKPSAPGVFAMLESYHMWEKIFNPDIAIKKAILDY